VVTTVNCLRSAADAAARAAERGGRPRLFVCLLHAAPHMLSSGSLYPPVFLDGWRYSYVDAVAGPRREIVGQLVTALCSAAEAGQAPAVTESSFDDPLASLNREQILREFCRRLRVVAAPSTAAGSLPGHLQDSPLSSLYDPKARTVAKQAALEHLLQPHLLPGLLDLISARVTLGLPAKRQGVLEMAAEVARGGAADSFSDMLDGRFLSTFLDGCSALLGLLTRDYGLLELERALTAGEATHDEALTLVEAALALEAAGAPARDGTDRRGPADVTVIVGQPGPGPGVLPFFDRLWPALQGVVDAVVAGGGAAMRPDEAARGVLEALTSEDSWAACGIVEAVHVQSGLALGAIRGVCGRVAGTRGGLTPEEAEFWLSWFTEEGDEEGAHAQGGVPLLVTVAVAVRLREAELRDVQSLVGVARESGQLPLLRQAVVEADGRTTAQALRGLLVRGLREQALELFSSPEQAAGPRWEERVREWVARCPIIRRHAHANTHAGAAPAAEADLIDLVCSVLTAAKDPSQPEGFHERAAVAQRLMTRGPDDRLRVIVRDLPAEMWEALGGVDAATRRVVVRLLLDGVVGHGRPPPSEPQLQALCQLMNGTHAASGDVRLDHAFRVHLLERLLGSARARQVGFVATVGAQSSVCGTKSLCVPS
jgi:hypothetical protein